MERPGEDTLVNYFSGQLSSQECKIVELYLAMEIDQEYVIHCMKLAERKMEHFAGNRTEEHQHALWEKFLTLRTRQPEAVVRRMPLWKKVSAAAAVVCAVVFTFLYLKPQHPAHHQTVRIKTSVTTDHAPGSNRAILVLGNGKTIDVTQKKNGQLAREGRTSIVKTHDGQLVYEDSNSQSVSGALVLNTLVVPRGGQYSLRLPDGTKVWLNAASSLIFPAQFSGGTREVTLKGEAYFEVAKNAKMPFHVKSGKMEVEVLGTHFNMMAYEDEPTIKTTLLEGSVRLTSGNKQVLLKPGQEGTLLAGNQFLIRTADLDQVMAWKNGRFIFNNEDLPSISRKLARWYNVSVVDERRDRTLTYTGTISRYQYVSDVLKMLELTGTMHYRIEDSKVIITKP